MATRVIGSEEAELRRRQAASQRGLFATIATGSRGARLLEHPGVQATVVPVRRSFAFFNSVFYDDPRALERALPTLEDEYAESAARAWTVWVPPGDDEASAMLEAAGYMRESSPMLMGAALSAIQLDAPERDEQVCRPTWQEAARCNDRAYGVPEQRSMAAVFEHVDDPACHLYGVAREGRVVSTLVAREHDGDCYFWFVATDPDAQREGLASVLVRHALREAKARGCTTTTLESTPAGESVYTRVGFRPFGRFEMRERRLEEPA
jgi:ribosomal protein S18 acetylase RimI-like enzyme